MESSTKLLDVVIIGGSYAGLAAAMGLGRSMRSVLVVDSGMPANRFTPVSHNFLTHDGSTPAEIRAIARGQLARYNFVQIIDATVANVSKTDRGFSIELSTGSSYEALTIILASGIIDIVPDISGAVECWGKSLLHCPYCHGYEVRNETTGILGNGNYAFEFGALIRNWTPDLTIYTNGPSLLSEEQRSRLQSHNIDVVEDEIHSLVHHNGYIESIAFRNGTRVPVKALYTKPAFKQHSEAAIQLGCELDDDGYIRIDKGSRTTLSGVYACGDSATKTRTVANAIAMGTSAAISLNKDLILKSF